MGPGSKSHAKPTAPAPSLILNVFLLQGAWFKTCTCPCRRSLDDISWTGTRLGESGQQAQTHPICQRQFPFFTLHGEQGSTNRIAFSADCIVNPPLKARRSKSTDVNSFYITWRCVTVMLFWDEDNTQKHIKYKLRVVEMISGCLLCWTGIALTKNCLILMDVVWSGMDPGFWSGGQQSFDPKGGPEPKIAKNRGFPSKLPENCMILEKSWGQGGPWIAPGSATGGNLLNPHGTLLGVWGSWHADDNLKIPT